MQPRKARVKNGQVVSEGDTLSDAERAELHRSLERGIAHADAGELIDADEVLAELER
jgi:hypothetical protein